MTLLELQFSRMNLTVVHHAERWRKMDRDRTKREPPRESLVNLILPLALILGLVLLLNLNAGQTSTQATESPLETWLKIIVGYLAAGAEIAAAFVIGAAVVRGIFNYVRQLFSRRQHIDSSEVIRLQLGRVLALGLEFTVASDILRTAVAPTRQDILNLGAIVLLRTLLNYFLEREIQQGERNRSSEAIQQSRAE
jgi:uncharacterized membrane protein